MSEPLHEPQAAPLAEVDRAFLETYIAPLVKPLSLYHSYTDAIPSDYKGVMGVPISFLDKYSPEQFEIIWQASGNTRASAPKEVLKRLKYNPHPDDRGGCTIINGQRTYDRILIKHKKKAK